MRPIDPSPYVLIYGLIVFLAPWLIYGSFIIRGLAYARSKGISLVSYTASMDIRRLRQSDSYAALLHKCALKWLIITVAMWLIGFAVLGLSLYVLHRTGIV